MALSSDVSSVLMGTVSQETKMRGSTRRNVSHILALFWVPTSDFPGTQTPSGPPMPRPPGKPIERQSQTSDRLATWGPTPVEIGWLFPKRLKNWHLPCSLKPPLLWLPPRSDFPPPSLGLSLRSMLREEALCKQPGQGLYVNQPRHLPARCGSARARSKAERTKTSAS